MEKSIKQLAIGGRRIAVNNIENKSLAQFKQQLRQNKVEVADATAEKLYHSLRGE